MSVEPLRTDITRGAVRAGWEQWARLGVSATGPQTPTRTATDPEALLLFTLEAGRHDPRLFGEMLDWLAGNVSLMSVQRADNLCRDDLDTRLLGGAMTWSGARRSASAPPAPAGAEEPLFYGLGAPQATDPVFLARGLRSPELTRSGKASRPEFETDAAFAFRLRRLVGLGARPEVLRLLLTVEAPRVQPTVAVRSAAFSGQNVREALESLSEAGVARRTMVGRERLYSVDRSAWATLLGELPTHRDWVQLLGALRLILRWLHQDGIDALSPYLLASRARAVVAPLLEDLRFAGVTVDDMPAAHGDAYWETFTTLTNRLLAAVLRP